MHRPKHEYVPGVCNIGQAEIKNRRTIGWIALAAGLIAWAVLIVLKAPAPWRLILFLPVTIAAMGYLQAAWHFCAKFGLNGVFNFGPDVGKTDTVEQAEFRRKDRQTALQIISLSGLIGVAVAVAAYFVPL